MKEPVFITITDQDIAHAPRKDYADCPVARALRKRFPEAKSVEVAIDSVFIDFGDRHNQSRFNFAPELREFIERFDRGESPKGGRFYAFDL